MIPIHYYLIFAALWTLVNGILHDVFVLKEGRPFDKELIRLLIDGHILIFSGVMLLLCVKGVKAQQPLAFQLTMAISIFILGYCALIFKMLPSIGMISIHLVLLVWLIISYPKG
jgi:hypothetical protein